MNSVTHQAGRGRMDTNLRGLIERIELSAARGLIPLFEAVSNAIDAIEERGLPTKDRSIDISLIEKQDLATEGGDTTFLVDGFEISDNGVGFNFANLNSFREAYTLSKASLGGKGMGRFTYLKVFSSVDISSVFESDDKRFSRSFTFTINDDVKDAENIEPTTLPVGTTITVRGLDPKYLSAWPRDPTAIATRVVEHFLIQFASRIAPRITLRAPDYSAIVLNDLFDQSIQPHIQEVTFQAGGHDFHLQVFRRTGNRSNHDYHLCAIGREVTKAKLRDLLPELPERLVDESGNNYSLLALVTGEYLDDHANRERTQIIFHTEDTLELDRTLLSRKTLNGAIAEVLRTTLEPDLSATNDAKVLQIEKFVERAPEYRALLSERYRPLIKKRIAPGLSDEKLDEALLHVRREIEDSVVKEEQHVAALMEKESYDHYAGRMQELISTMNEVGKAKLASYIGHRRTIIDLVSHSLKKHRDDDKYPLEKVLHKMIFPMGATSNDIFFDQQNLWMIDERLCFHTLLTSDKKLNGIKGLEGTSGREPDIFSFFYDTPIATAEPGQPASGGIVIIEFKRPNYDKYDRDPAEQIINRIDEILQGNVKDIDGRPINPTNIRFAGYFIADITPTLKRHVRLRYNATPDGEGYFCTLPGVTGYIEIISYDRMVSDAKKRNRMFFEKLGIHKD